MTHTNSDLAFMLQRWGVHDHRWSRRRRHFDYWGARIDVPIKGDLPVDPRLMSRVYHLTGMSERQFWAGPAAPAVLEVPLGTYSSFDPILTVFEVLNCEPGRAMSIHTISARASHRLGWPVGEFWAKLDCTRLVEFGVVEELDFGSYRVIPGSEHIVPAPEPASDKIDDLLSKVRHTDQMRSLFGPGWPAKVDAGTLMAAAWPDLDRAVVPTALVGKLEAVIQQLNMMQTLGSLKTPARS